ncbi:hypothetical protein C6P46_002720 [Rhodotorula mucilaginosa]|uniref:Thioesterase domain-containing protein n=1 Tax=Rhodotorula mucilaginosa TaxID=5537 RepID=A0A9P6W5Y1_RHOMI|nr:hypothetical protein C6P46_002720 [Rhodotorula mucilaginosa]
MSARQALGVLQPRTAIVRRSALLAAARFHPRRLGSPLPAPPAAAAAAPFSTAASKPSHAADSTPTQSRPRVDPQQPQEAKQSRRGLILLSSALLSTGLLAGIGLTFFVPRPRIVSLVFPLPTNHPPPRESPEHRAHTKEIERDLMQLEVVKQLQAETVPAPAPTSSGEDQTPTATKEGTPAPLVKKYTVSRPYAATPPGPHSLSAYTLRGPGKFAVPPLVFTTQDKRESVLILHVGDGLCGHEGVVHGGLLATVLDEALGRTALLNLPTNIGVTATLSLKYKKPTFANQFLVIRTELTEQRGRKAWVRGKVEDLDGQTLVEAE